MAVLHQLLKLAAVDLQPADFRKGGKHKVKGARRPLRVKPADIRLEAGVDDYGGHITVAFSLPAGSYATVFLRELMKADDPSEKENSGSQERSPEVEGVEDVTPDDEAAQTDAPSSDETDASDQ